nr:RNA-directed DNA polymerase, eukaryota [Tanacetum cinerariifolium]
MGFVKSNGDHTREISQSLFVTNFPESTQSGDLWKVCSTYGTVIDMFIPNKRSKSGKRFAFVRYIKVFNLVRLVENLCIIWIGRYHLYANQVRFERPRKSNFSSQKVMPGAPVRKVNPTGASHFPKPSYQKASFASLVTSNPKNPTAKELFAWSPSFKAVKDIEYCSDNDVNNDDIANSAAEDNYEAEVVESDDDYVLDTKFDDQEVNMKHGFTEKCSSAEKESGIQLTFSPGFTPDKDECQDDIPNNDHGDAGVKSSIRSHSEDLSPRVMEDAQPTNAHESNKGGKDPISGGSILEVLENMIKLFLDCLPTRSNLLLRGVNVPDSSCTVCASAQETVAHLFFSCDLSLDVSRLICRWWNVVWSPIGSFSEWLTWFQSIRLNSLAKRLLEGVFYVSWWSIWMFRNQVLFSACSPRKDVFFDDIVTRSFTYCHSRCSRTFNWDSWLQHPYLISL